MRVKTNKDKSPIADKSRFDDILLLIFRNIHVPFILFVPQPLV
jgi:hypothetical protein